MRKFSEPETEIALRSANGERGQTELLAFSSVEWRFRIGGDLWDPRTLDAFRRNQLVVDSESLRPDPIAWLVSQIHKTAFRKGSFAETVAIEHSPSKPKVSMVLAVALPADFSDVLSQ